MIVKVVIKLNTFPKASSFKEKKSKSDSVFWKYNSKNLILTNAINNVAIACIPPEFEKRSTKSPNTKARDNIGNLFFLKGKIKIKEMYK